MARRAGRGQMEPPCAVGLGKSVMGETLQAASVLQAGRPADVAAERQPMQRGAAAGFQIWLVPHGCYVGRDPLPCNRLSSPAGLRQTARMFSALASALLPVLRRLDPERAHGLALRALALGLVRADHEPDDPRLGVLALGLRFPNPIGLAAGFDKDAAALPALARLGFGFVEAGTVTLRPQAGNPRPRLFRLTEDRAVINRMGFNNGGIDGFRRAMAGFPRGLVPVGANVGINKEGADPERDYPALVAAVAPVADYVVVNVSSPNTPGLRDLQGEARLRGILDAMAAAVPHHPPVLVKIAPDLSDEGLDAVVDTCLGAAVRGMIVSNTTIARPGGLRSPHAGEPGGLSGAPLFARSTELLRRAARRADGRLTFIGVGGVRTGRDVLVKLRAGAQLVQLYTEFAYAGPALIPRLKRELLAALRQDGFSSVADAVGADL